MDHLDKITPFLFNPFTGTILFVIAIGYIVRAIDFISNKLIPLLGILLGTICFTVIAPMTLKVDPDHHFASYFLFGIVGVVVSSAGWAVHNYALGWLENWLRNKFPKLDDVCDKTIGEQRDPAPDKKDG